MLFDLFYNIDFIINFVVNMGRYLNLSSQYVRLDRSKRMAARFVNGEPNLTCFVSVFFRFDIFVWKKM